MKRGKWIRALPMAIMAGAMFCGGAPACPPPAMESADGAPRRIPSREEVLAERAILYPNIFHAEVRSPIWPRRPGLLRILHVYKGDLRAGQLLTMQYREEGTDCGPGLVPPEQRRAGAYGVIMLPELMNGRVRMFVGDDEGEVPRFGGFVPESDVQAMIDAGILRSARGSGVSDERVHGR